MFTHSAVFPAHLPARAAVLLVPVLFMSCGGGDPLIRARQDDPSAVSPAAAEVAAAVHAALPPAAVSSFDPELRPELSDAVRADRASGSGEPGSGQEGPGQRDRHPGVPVFNYPSLRFLVLSDIHHLSPELWEPGWALARFLGTNDGKVLARSAELLAAIESTVRGEHAGEELDFAVITGDLTTNGSPESHRDIAELASRLHATGIPTFVVPGNHDINNPWARRYPPSRPEALEGVGPRAFRRIYAAAGYDEAVSRGPDDLSYRVDIDSGAALFLLDSAMWRTNQELGYPQPTGEIGAEQRRWLESQLADARAAGLAPLVFMHHPAVNHDPAMDYGTRQYVIAEGPRFVRLLQRFGVPMLFSGHLHVRKTTVAGGETAGHRPFFDLAAGAASIYPHEYRVVTIDGPTQELHLTPGRITGFTDPAFRRWSLATYLSDFASGYVPRVREEQEQVPADALTAMAFHLGAWELQHRDGVAHPSLLDHLVNAAPALQRGREAWMRHAPARYRDFAGRYGEDPDPPNREIVIDLSTGSWHLAAPE